MASSLITDLLKTPSQIRKENDQRLLTEGLAQAQLATQGNTLGGVGGMFANFGAQQAAQTGRNISNAFRGVTDAIGTVTGADLRPADERAASAQQKALSGIQMGNVQSMEAKRQELVNAGAPAAVLERLDKAIVVAKDKEAEKARLARVETRAESAEARAAAQEERAAEMGGVQLQAARAQLETLQRAANDNEALRKSMPAAIESVPSKYMSDSMKVLVASLPVDQQATYVINALQLADSAVQRTEYMKGLQNTFGRSMSQPVVDDAGKPVLDENGEPKVQPSTTLTNNQRIQQIKRMATQARADGQESVAETLEAKIPLLSGGLSYEDIGEKTLSFKKTYDSDPRIKDAETALSAAQSVMTSISTDSGAGDIATIFQFMKALDPRSVVREGEFDLAADLGGMFAKLSVYADQAKSGRKLSGKARKEIAELTLKLAQGHAMYATQVRDNERVAYNTMGLDVDVITGKDKVFKVPTMPDNLGTVTTVLGGDATDQDYQGIVENYAEYFPGSNAGASAQ